MAPPALAYQYATQSDVEALLSIDGLAGRVDDLATGTINATEQGYIASAINWATARVNQFCLGLYAAADLANSWIVNNWTVVLAARWLSCRRGNPPPGSFDDLYKEVLEDLKDVRAGRANLPDIGLRTAAWPAWSNVRVDCLYSLRKIRVERPISERSATDYRQSVDWPSVWIVEP